MKTLLASLLLATTCQAQTLLFEDFNNGFPVDWSKRFGRVEDSRLSFANRSTSTDVWTTPLDFSGGGDFVLRFDLMSVALSDHNLVVLLKGAESGAFRIAGSAFLASRDGLGLILNSGEGLESHELELGPYFGLFQPSELSSLQLGFVSLNSAGLSSAPIYLDSLWVGIAEQVAASQAYSQAQSAIPEPACEACIVGLIVALFAWFKRKALT